MHHICSIISSDVDSRAYWVFKKRKKKKGGLFFKGFFFKKSEGEGFVSKMERVYFRVYILLWKHLCALFSSSSLAFKCGVFRFSFFAGIIHYLRWNQTKVCVFSFEHGYCWKNESFVGEILSWWLSFFNLVMIFVLYDWFIWFYNPCCVGCLLVEMIRVLHTMHSKCLMKCLKEKFCFVSWLFFG